MLVYQTTKLPTTNYASYAMNLTDHTVLTQNLPKNIIKNTLN